MKKLCLITLFMIGVSVHAISQTPVFDLEWTTLGRVNMVQSNYGICGFDVAMNEGGLLYPRTNGWQYLFASGMWLGGWVRIDGELEPRVLGTYDVASGIGCAIPGELSNGRQVRADLADKYQLQRAINGSIEVFSSRYHLGDTTRYQGANRRRIPGLSDLEIREWTYAMDDEAMADIIIRRFEFINTGSDTIFAFVPAWVIDPDVGDPSNSQLAAAGDRHHPLVIDPQTVYYIARDNDDSKTGEIGFVVLASPLESRVNALVDGPAFITVTQHRERYQSMTSGMYFPELGAGEVSALYAMSQIEVFAPGDTLRYTAAFVMMSPAERTQRLASGGSALTQYYADAATRIRARVADLPTSVDEDPVSNEALVIAPHPITDHWTIRAPAGMQWQIAIHAIDGQLIHRTVTHADGTADGPELPPGVYHLVASNGEQRLSRVIVR